MLKYFVDDTKTDKNTVHSYLEAYEPFIRRIRDTAKNVMEIGILHGGGVKLFHNYFARAKIYALDTMHYTEMPNELKVMPRVILGPSSDAYTSDCVQFLKNQNLKFDFILDDGPHSLESNLYILRNYLDLLTDDGILIIEDIQKYEWIPQLMQAVPEELRKAVFVIDRREVKGRYDDVLFVFDKYYL
jgi:hypothetical protein